MRDHLCSFTLPSFTWLWENITLLHSPFLKNFCPLRLSVKICLLLHPLSTPGFSITSRPAFVFHLSSWLISTFHVSSTYTSSAMYGLCIAKLQRMTHLELSSSSLRLQSSDIALSSFVTRFWTLVVFSRVCKQTRGFPPISLFSLLFRLTL